MLKLATLFMLHFLFFTGNSPSSLEIRNITLDVRCATPLDSNDLVCGVLTRPIGIGRLCWPGHCVLLSLPELPHLDLFPLRCHTRCRCTCMALFSLAVLSGRQSLSVSPAHSAHSQALSSQVTLVLKAFAFQCLTGLL
jgi:hypothetical protein